jgi:hypothetical protein
MHEVNQKKKEGTQCGTKMLQISAKELTNFPKPVTGKASPYPTVVKVTIHHQNV